MTAVPSSNGREVPPVHASSGSGRDASPRRPQGSDNERPVGTAVPAVRQDLVGTAVPAVRRNPVGTAVPAVRDRDNDNGRLGDAALPKQSLRQRKWLGHSVPSWIDCGIFFITINSDERGQAPLLADGVITCVRDAALHYHGYRWWIHLWLIMPDHIHALLSFPQDQNMIKVVADWKRFVARNAGVKWQKGFFDHRLRHDESLVEKAHYIRMNPVRKELVQSPEDWPHVWAFDGRDGSPSRPQPTTLENEPVGTAVPAVHKQGANGSVGTALRAVRECDDHNGRLVGTALRAVRECDKENGRLGEASLPIPSQPCAEVSP